MKNEGFRVKVLRYDPGKDEAPYYRTYRLERGRKMRILDLLIDIYRNDNQILFTR